MEEMTEESRKSKLDELKSMEYALLPGQCSPGVIAKLEEKLGMMSLASKNWYRPSV